MLYNHDSKMSKKGEYDILWVFMIIR